MEHLNRIELIGRVGAVNITKVSSTETLNRFTIAVNSVYKGAGGTVVQTDWFQCVYWGESDKFVKGNDIPLEGRIHVNRYTDDEGNSHSYVEVKVNKIY